MKKIVASAIKDAYPISIILGAIFILLIGKSYFSKTILTSATMLGTFYIGYWSGKYSFKKD